MGARTSATRSHSVTSVSWPTAEITGTGSAATARATRSWLKVQRSSREPPPRPMMARSNPSIRHSSARAAQISAAAPSPCTRVGTTSSSASGQRRAVTAMMSCKAAPSGLVTTPMRSGYGGSGRLRAGSSSPSLASAAFVFSKASCHSPPASVESRSTTVSRKSPFSSQTVGRAKRNTCMPSSGGAGRRRLSFWNMTQRICALRSRSVKYQ